ncbi:MAG: FG-GAP repeat protein, partial [Deltaproteobacteria bacterium]|nr:FG-GAP repeat protein [Deltaproteobacteria bacterium]
MKPARSIRLRLPPTAALPWIRVPGVSVFALSAIVFVVALGGVVACGSSGDGGSSDSSCGSGECKILASDGQGIDTFGFSVAIAGDVIVVGAASDDFGNRSGSAYVYRFDGADWVEEQKLTASDPMLNQQFGISVATSGDLIVVGAQLDEDSGASAGAAYIYRFDGASWVEEQKLLASDGATGALFGIAVAIAGNAIVVGAFNDDDSGSLSGSAYVFRFDGTNWVEEDKLTASDGAAFKFFGNSVAISADLIVVGAEFDGENGLFAGAAYVYRFDGTDWIEEQKLTGSDGASGDLFGFSVAIAGDVVVVGANRDDEVGEDSGSAYVYRYDGVTW